MCHNFFKLNQTFILAVCHEDLEFHCVFDGSFSQMKQRKVTVKVAMVIKFMCSCPWLCSRQNYAIHSHRKKQNTQPY